MLLAHRQMRQPRQDVRAIEPHIFCCLRIQTLMTKELPEDPDERQRHTLWTVLLLNAAIAIGFFATGTLGDSSALIANGLDNTSDSFVYAISLFALSRADKWKRGAANVSGGLLLLFAVGILIDAVRRYYTGSEPLGPLMISMALIAAVVNGIAFGFLVGSRTPT